MSVLIKGVEMPKHVSVNGEKDTAYKCVILAHPDNSVELVIDIKFASAYDNGHNIQRYLITEIPTPHGRLIDADRLLESFSKAIDEDGHLVNFFALVEEAPTIIEAGVSEE